MNIKFITNLAEFTEELNKGEVVISQESILDDTERMFWFIKDGDLKMVTTVAEGVFKAINIADIYTELQGTLLYVVIGSKITYQGTQGS